MRQLSVIWAIVVVLGVLLFAVFRLAQHSWVALQMPLGWLEYSVLLINTLFMAYSEGYKGFHLSFAPRFAARVKYVYQQGQGVQLWLSPLFCFGYFGTTKAKQVVAFALTILLICVIVLMGYMPQPWRGVVDAGVVVGLSIGVLSMLYWLLQEYKQLAYLHSPEVPQLS